MLTNCVSRLALRFHFVAVLADALQVVILLRSALRDWNLVITYAVVLAVERYQAGNTPLGADLAHKPIALKDPPAYRPPL